MKMIRKPAMAGPIIRVIFIAELTIAMLLISFDSGTISETIACRLGMLNAIIDPLMVPDTKICQNVMVFVISRIPITRIMAALPPCANTINRFRGIRSASAPPIRDTNVIGKANEAMTKASASGESLATRRTSQPRVIHSMFMAMKDVSALVHSLRKSWTLNESKVRIRAVSECINVSATCWR